MPVPIAPRARTAATGPASTPPDGRLSTAAGARRTVQTTITPAAIPSGGIATVRRLTMKPLTA